MAALANCGHSGCDMGCPKAAVHWASHHAAKRVAKALISAHRACSRFRDVRMVANNRAACGLFMMSPAKPAMVAGVSIRMGAGQGAARDKPTARLSASPQHTGGQKCSSADNGAHRCAQIELGR